MNQNPFITVLLTLPPRPLPGVDLLARLCAARPATVDELLEVGPEIEAAIEKADLLAYRSLKAIERCCALKPVSAPRTPTGF